MAGSSRIKGITIEIDGETTGLQKALSDVTKESIDIQRELKDVERLLKFDPGNAEALAQKQQLLQRQLENTTTKLERLKEAQEQVDRQFQNGEIGESQYRAFRREIEFTERELDNLRGSLNQVGNNDSLDNLANDAEEAQDSVKDLSGELTGIAAGIAAGMGLGEVIEKALDTSSLNTKIEVAFNVPPESLESVREAISVAENYGIEAESALEGVRRQWALNKDASDESNAAVIQGASTIVAAYGDVDFTELIQETNEFSKGIGVSNEEALALYYSLFKIGFPADQVDIIAEYGTQLKMAGFNAEQIQAIMASGVENGTWDINNLLDGLGEARKLLTEFGLGIDDTTASLLENTNISKEQLQSWGQAVASGGEAGATAMQEVSKALLSVEDDTTRNNLGVKIFGTMWEDQGSVVAETLAGMNEHLTTAEENQNNLNSATEALNADPAIQMQTAISNLMIALSPLLTLIAEVVGKIAEWVANNPTLAATITAIVTTIGILLGIMASIAPIITMISSLIPVLSVSIGAIAAPVLIVIGVITALIAIGVLLYQNWDTIKTKASEIWEGIKATISSVITGIVNFFTVTIPEAINSMISWFESLPEKFSSLWTSIATVFTDTWNSIVTFFTESIPAWLESMYAWFAELPNKIAYGLGEALGSIIKWGMDTINYLTTNVPVWIENISKWFSELPGKVWTWLVNVITKLGEWGSNVVSWISSNVSAWITNVVNYFSQLPSKIWEWLVNVVNNIKTWGSEMLSAAKSGMQQVFDGIVDTFKNLPSRMLDIGKNIVAGIKNGIKSAWDGMTGWIGGLCDSFVNGVKEALDIHSPSRVMKKLGEFTGEGFQIGIKSTIGDISNQANELANAAIPQTKDISYEASLNTNDISSNFTLENIITKLNNLENVFSNIAIYMDSTKVGKLVAGAVSNNMAFSGSRKGWK